MNDLSSTSGVVVRVEGACGRITLDRPRAMNALNLEMVERMLHALSDWAADASIQFVLVDGAGERGLCAGGDIRALYQAAVSGDHAPAARFFREEYRLNHLIASYPKPYVVLMDGVVMGGGIGISSHGSHRIVTERSSLAMPETGIGFCPDIGGTYLLGMAPGESGTYLALTADRAAAADAIACRLADVFVPSDQLPQLTREIERCTSRPALEACIERFAATPPPGLFERQRPWIDACFAPSSVEEILDALEARTEPEAHAAAAEIRKKSPIALKVTLASLRRAREYNDLAACLEQEYGVSLAFLGEPDFAEGVRAAVVDKDRNPKWKPARLEDVSDVKVASFFREHDSEPLQLSTSFSESRR